MKLEQLDASFDDNDNLVIKIIDNSRKVGKPSDLINDPFISLNIDHFDGDTIKEKLTRARMFADTIVDYSNGLDPFKSLPDR